MKKKMQKKDVAVLAVIGAVVFLLGGVLLFVLQRYNTKGLALMAELEGKYEYNGILLQSQGDGGTDYVFRSLPPEHFKKAERISLDLAEYGLSGTFEHYQVEAYYASTDLYRISVSPADEGLWPACRGDAFVVRDGEGRLYRIHPEEKLCYPALSDSIEGVDPYGKDILAFSGLASYAVGMNGTAVTVYHTDPMDSSLRVVDVKTVELAEYGTDPKFVAFVSNTHCYFTLQTDVGVRFVALDCATGELAPSALPEGDYGEIKDRHFAQKNYEPDEDARVTAAWVETLLGTEKGLLLPKEYRKAALYTVSTEGNYAVFDVKTDDGADLLVMNEKKAYPLSAVTPEGERIEKVDFLCDNVILVTFLRQDGSAVSRSFTVCF